jgi:hypothetical protein
MDRLRTLKDPFVLPPWLTEDDLMYYVNEYRSHGFSGGLNYVGTPPPPPPPLTRTHTHHDRHDNHHINIHHIYHWCFSLSHLAFKTPTHLLQPT